MTLLLTTTSVISFNVTYMTQLYCFTKKDNETSRR